MNIQPEDAIKKPKEPCQCTQKQKNKKRQYKSKQSWFRYLLIEENI